VTADLSLTSINGHFTKAVVGYFGCTTFVTVESAIFALEALPKEPLEQLLAVLAHGGPGV